MQGVDEFMRTLQQRLPNDRYVARMYCPREYAEFANRQLNVAWNDSGDNLSRELSPTGRRPWTYKSGNYAGITLDHLQSLLAVFSKCPGSLCVICGLSPSGDDTKIVGVFGIEGDPLVGQIETWRSTAEKLLGITPSDEFYWALDNSPLDLMLQTVISPEAPDSEGMLIRSICVPWLDIASAIEHNHQLLYEFTNDPRKFEEFLAATYDRAGFEVILTPRSGDRGRDVIASKKGFGAIRILDQAKAYKPGHLVTHNDVRAMLGTLSTNPNSSKGVITTTSSFQPRITESEEFKPLMPYRLQLVDGISLREWVKTISQEI